MNTLLDQWLSLSEAEFVKVVHWTPEKILFKVMEEDIEGKLWARLQKSLAPQAFETLRKRAFASRKAAFKRAA